MTRPAGGLRRSSAPDWSHLLSGCDTTPGIVAIEADYAGNARIWRRAGGLIQVTEERFPNWFLATSLDLLAHLPTQHFDAGALRSAHGQVSGFRLSDGVSVVELEPRDPTATDPDTYRYLVLTDRLTEVETALVEMSNKLDGGEAQTLADLRGLVLAWPPIEQFLILTGRTYFKGMAFDDLRRMQFDLETTGLDEDRDRIFMISMRDSDGWQACLDTTAGSEAQLIDRFVEIVRERDPDVLENHNIFAFDLPFLVKRAARLGARLGLGRDGSEPRLETDVFDNGERAEPFLRWRVAGREVIDTQHAVRRFGFAAPDMRRHGLKDAARYFGFARPDREYVPGVEVWPTFRTDPQRIRRYSADDVDEVDGLSRRLLPEPFGLATMLPRAYERIAANCGAAALWEPLLVRAYLHEGRAISAPMVRQQPPPGGPRPELLLTGVVAGAARAALPSLLPRVLAEHDIAAANDDLGVVPHLVARLLERADDASAVALAAAAPAYLGGQGLFSDPEAARAAGRAARQCVDRLLENLRSRGCVIVQIAAEQVLFGRPSGWTPAVEQQVALAAAEYVPRGVRVVFDEHYAALYARAPGNAMMLAENNEAVTLVGNSFRSGRLERFGEAFMHRAAAFALRGDAPGLRQLFLDTVHRVRTAQIALEDLCVLVTLHKSPPQYRRADTREEPYEILLQASVRSWRVGQRIRYFRARGGEPRLHVEADGLTAAEVDAEFYVQRLANMYAQQFAQAFRREDFGRIFSIPAGPGPFVEAAAPALSAIRPIVQPVVPRAVS